MDKKIRKRVDIGKRRTDFESQDRSLTEARFEIQYGLGHSLGSGQDVTVCKTANLSERKRKKANTRR